MREIRVIILFVKHPEPGRVKTRLARTLGDREAVDVYRRLVEYLIRLLARVEVDELHICFDPGEKQREIEQWLRSRWQEAREQSASRLGGEGETKLLFCPQSSGDLGDRLQASFSDVFTGREGDEIDQLKVLAIGSDCIEIREDTFCAAWESLKGNEVVFGPSADGGYYLVAMKQFHGCLFDEIPWSTTETLEVSLARARENALSVALLDEKHDIDTEDDWIRAQALLSQEDSL